MAQPQTLSKQGQEDASSSASDYHALRFIVDRVLNRASTTTLVQIKNGPYDSNGNSIQAGAVGNIGFVDVLPLVNQLDGSGNSVPHQVVHGFPYFRYHGGSNAIIVDPQKGDIGLAVFADRDISAVKQNKAQSNPGSKRRFDMADGIYIGMCLSSAPNQYITFTPNGIVIADKNGNKITMSSNGIDITATRLTNSGSIIAGFGGGDSVTLQNHTHNQANDSHGDTEQPTNAPNAGT